MYLPRIMQDLEAFFSMEEKAVLSFFDPLIKQAMNSGGQVLTAVATDVVKQAISDLGSNASPADILSHAETTALNELKSQGISAGDAILKAALSAALVAIQPTPAAPAAPAAPASS